MSRFKDSIIAILNGKFLLAIGVDRYFVHILYTFCLMALAILLSFHMENTMAKVQKNGSEITELDIIRSQREYENVCIRRRANTAELLKELGSEVGKPEKNAIPLKKQ